MQGCQEACICGGLIGAVGNKLCIGVGYSLTCRSLLHILYSVMKMERSGFPQKQFSTKNWFINFHAFWEAKYIYTVTTILTI